MTAEEVIFEQWVLRLDGNVVELLHSTASPAASTSTTWRSR